jgi:hypothetical protein
LILSPEAFDEVSRKVNECKKTYCFLTFHAQYYSDDYKWGVSVVNSELLNKLAIDCFVTLIDDIYDIHLFRDTDNDGIIGEVANCENRWERLMALLDLTTKQLIQYIRLRQEEVVLTDSFAGNKKAHIFSIKHPISTLLKLINNQNNTIYFSHPISAVRRELQDNHLLSFDESVLYNSIATISDLLRKTYVLVEPTTIDELRFKDIIEVGDKNDVGTIRTHTLPILSKRWTFLEDAPKLVYALKENENINSIVSDESIDYLQVRPEWEQLIRGEAPAEYQRVTVQKKAQ